jgi:hypothetical protein
MSRTPAAELARVKQQHPTWVIEKLDSGWFTARRDWHGSQQIITVPTLAELENRLSAQERHRP